MTYENKFQILKNKKFMMILLIGLLFVVIGIIRTKGLLHFSNLNLYTDTNKVEEVLQDQRFIYVKQADGEFNYGYGRHNFDLQKNNYFGGGVVIEDSSIYGIEREVEEIYETYYYNYITSAIINADITLKTVRNSNYKVIIEPSEIVEERFLKEEFPPEVENAYVKLGLQKVRITYNKDFLPTKLEFKREGRAWETIRTYSYPYNTEKEFKKGSDDYMEFIKKWEVPDDADVD